MSVVEFTPLVEKLPDPKHEVVYLQMPMQLAALVLGLKNSKNCTISVKKKGQNSSCKLEGNSNAITAKMNEIFNLIRRRGLLAMADMALNFNVRPEIVGSILGKGGATASLIRTNLFAAIHAYKNLDVSTICIKGRLDRLWQLYLGIQRLDKLYGSATKFTVHDQLFNATHVGQVPSKAIPTPLLHNHAQMQNESKATIVYDLKTVNGQFKKATVSGHIWQVERAVSMILEASDQKAKKLQKKGKKIVRRAEPLNPVVEDGNATIIVPSHMVGLVVGKKGATLKNIESTFDVKVEIKPENTKDATTKLFVTSKRQNGDRQIFDAIFWIHSMIRRARKSDKNKVNKATTFKCGICLEEEVAAHDGVACSDFLGNNEDDTIHSFCNDCVSELAKQLSNPFSEIPLGVGGVGLCCPEVGCPNVMLLSTIRWLLNRRDLDRLEQRCMRESIKMAGIDNLVTCYGCDNMVILEGGHQFECPDCKRNQCRDCPREYDQRHFGKTCQQVDNEEIEERRKAIQRGEIAKIHDEMSETLIRKCPGCAVPMTKLIGCNKITCHKCNMVFCYICLAERIDYKHFDTNQGQCELFADFNDMNVNDGRIQLLEQRIQQIYLAA